MNDAASGTAQRRAFPCRVTSIRIICVRGISFHQDQGEEIKFRRNLREENRFRESPGGPRKILRNRGTDSSVSAMRIRRRQAELPARVKRNRRGSLTTRASLSRRGRLIADPCVNFFPPTDGERRNGPPGTLKSALFARLLASESVQWGYAGERERENTRRFSEPPLRGLLRGDGSAGWL